MKRIWIVSLALAASTGALAQTTIYKHIDDRGRVTYTNKPMKDAVIVELEPITTIPATPAGMLQPQKPANSSVAAAPAQSPAPEKSGIKPAVAIVTPTAMPTAVSFASVDLQTQKRRDEDRRRILEDELTREQRELTDVRKSLLEEQRNPALVAAVRLAQETLDPTPTQRAEFRANIDKASGRIRGLQATAAEHEKNIEALKKELGAPKP
jgi:hypothetical protein